MNDRSNTVDQPATEAQPAEAKRRIQRRYKFEAPGVEPWAVPALIKLVTDRAVAASEGRLEREAIEVEVTIYFEAFESEPEPQFGWQWGVHHVDPDRTMGFGWTFDSEREL